MSTACLPAVVLTSGGMSASASAAVEIVRTLARADGLPASEPEQADRVRQDTSATDSRRVVESGMTNRVGGWAREVERQPAPGGRWFVTRL